MKFYKLMIFALALATAVTTVGCGGSDDEAPKPGQAGYVGGAAVVPNGYSPYCQAGQLFNGANCVPSTGGQVACQAGYTWNQTYGTCLPSSYSGNCPTNTMSWSGAGCTGFAPQSNYTGWQCSGAVYDYSTHLYYQTCQQVAYVPTYNYGYQYCYWTRYGTIACQ